MAPKSPDGMVGVVSESREWSGNLDSDDEAEVAFDRVATERFLARERVLSMRIEELDRDRPMGDKEIDVVTMSTDWAECDASEPELEPSDAEDHQTTTFSRRERRLTATAEALRNVNVLWDVEVDVVDHPQEWAGGSDSDDEIEKVAATAYTRRERRLTASSQVMEEAGPSADKEVDLLAESKEWAGVEDSDDDDEGSGALDAKMTSYQSERFEIRERRLTSGAEMIEQDGPNGDREVSLVTASSEWAAGGDSDDEEADEEEVQPGEQAMEAKMSRHQTVRFELRERRLTASAEMLEEATPGVDKEVRLVTESAEWAAAEDSDAGEEEASAAMTSYQSERFETRERRLTAGAELLQAASRPSADREVGLKMEHREWAEAEDSDDEPEKHATAAFQRRERRLTSGVEAAQWGCQGRDKEVSVVQEAADWACADDSDDEKDTEDVFARCHTERFEVRERRLTSGAAALEKECPGGDKDVSLVSESKEWIALDGEDSGDDVGDGMARHQTDRFERRERRLTAAEELLEKQAVPTKDKDISIVDAAEEWPAAGEDTDDEAEEDEGKTEQMKRHHSEAFERRERRLTENAEALQS